MPTYNLIYIATALTVVLVLVFLLLKKSKKNQTIQQTWTAENKAVSEHWNAQEGDWDGYNIRKRNQEIELEKLEKFENEFFKATLPILYNNFPELENLDSKGYAQLKHLLAQQTEQLRNQIKNLKTKHLQKN